ncbi:unnamed protein product [Amoebophrya sp. A120]|nr:unnamed protein product [Amoebophrya sp. A120]|eukprot:GSA120T00005141001.1
MTLSLSASPRINSRMKRSALLVQLASRRAVISVAAYDYQNATDLGDGIREFTVNHEGVDLKVQELVQQPSFLVERQSDFHDAQGDSLTKQACETLFNEENELAVRQAFENLQNLHTKAKKHTKASHKHMKEYNHHHSHAIVSLLGLSSGAQAERGFAERGFAKRSTREHQGRGRRHGKMMKEKLHELIAHVTENFEHGFEVALEEMTEIASMFKQRTQAAAASLFNKEHVPNDAKQLLSQFITTFSDNLNELKRSADSTFNSKVAEGARHLTHTTMHLVHTHLTDALIGLKNGVEAKAVSAVFSHVPSFVTNKILDAVEKGTGAEEKLIQVCQFLENLSEVAIRKTVDLTVQIGATLQTVIFGVFHSMDDSTHGITPEAKHQGLVESLEGAIEKRNHAFRRTRSGELSGSSYLQDLEERLLPPPPPPSSPTNALGPHSNRGGDVLPALSQDFQGGVSGNSTFIGLTMKPSLPPFVQGAFQNMRKAVVHQAFALVLDQVENFLGDKLATVLASFPRGAHLVGAAFTSMAHTVFDSFEEHVVVPLSWALPASNDGTSHTKKWDEAKKGILKDFHDVYDMTVRHAVYVYISDIAHAVLCAYSAAVPVLLGPTSKDMHMKTHLSVLQKEMFATIFPDDLRHEFWKDEEKIFEDAENEKTELNCAASKSSQVVQSNNGPRGPRPAKTNRSVHPKMKDVIDQEVPDPGQDKD